MSKKTHRRTDGTPRSAGGEPPAGDPRVLPSDPLPPAKSAKAAASKPAAKIKKEGAPSEAPAKEV